jgi:hypothetical protein
LVVSPLWLIGHGSQSFPIYHIASMEKVGGRKRTMGNDDYGLDIFLKDTRIIRFVFERESPVYPPPRRMTHTKILKGYPSQSHSVPLHPVYHRHVPLNVHRPRRDVDSLIRPASRLFAFDYHASLQRATPPLVDGWKIYDADKEYKRYMIT